MLCSVQKHALSAGAHHLKCPYAVVHDATAAKKDPHARIFQNQILEQGIYVPRRYDLGQSPPLPKGRKLSLIRTQLHCIVDRIQRRFVGGAGLVRGKSTDALLPGRAVSLPPSSGHLTPSSGDLQPLGVPWTLSGTNISLHGMDGNWKGVDECPFRLCSYRLCAMHIAQCNFCWHICFLTREILSQRS